MVIHHAYTTIRSKMKHLHGNRNFLLTMALLHIAIFLAMTIAVLAGNGFLWLLPPQILQSLGAAPSPSMISSLLMLYSFSAILLTLCRILGQSTKGGGMQHVAILFGFYLFYDASGSLELNYNAVLVAGTTILTLNAYRFWIAAKTENN